VLKRGAFLAIVACALFVAPPAGAQVTRDQFEALKSEVGALREGIKAQSELLKQFLERLGAGRGDAPFKETLVAVDGDAVYGKPSAKVTIVEFSDYQCPFCARYSNETFPQIEREYIETGRVRYVFRDFPIEAAHPLAFKAHEAVHCAAEQGKRREMHKKVFANQRAMRVNDFTAHAAAVGLDKARFEKCLVEARQAAKV
jgi:protein-disulfide isomerase